jgi:FkbM family methyltransferase
MREQQEVMVDIGGKSFRIMSDDDYLDHIKNGFEPDMVKLFRALAAGSDTVLDVGANIGCTAILFGELAKNVYAFEPSQGTFAFLENNIVNSTYTNIFARNVGLGAETGELPLTVAPWNRSGGFVSNQTQASVGHIIERIQICKLDDVVKSMNLAKIDFIKIDVEGFEGHVLRGATETLRTHKPVVVLELNHWCLNAFQRTSVPDFLDLLRLLFPILLAIDGSSYLNLYDESESYSVMYHHIIHNRFMNVVGAFDESRLGEFRASYQHHFAG